MPNVEAFLYKKAKVIKYRFFFFRCRYVYMCVYVCVWGGAKGARIGGLN